MIFTVDIKLYRFLLKIDNITKEYLIKVYQNFHFPSLNKFKKLYNDFDNIDKLFILYIIEEKKVTFVDRWMAQAQIEDII